MRLALVSTSGTPTATKLLFWRLRALGTSEIGFLGERRLTLTGRMFPNVENTISWLFVKLFSGVQPRVQLEVSGLRSQLSGPSSQVSGLRSQVSGLRSQVSGLRSQVAGLRCQVSGLRSQVSGVMAKDSQRI